MRLDVPNIEEDGAGKRDKTKTRYRVRFRGRHLHSR